MKFSSKTTLFFSILVVSTVAIVSYLIYSSAADKLKDDGMDRLSDHAYHTAAKMDELFHDALEDTQLLSKSVAFNLSHENGYALGHAHGLDRVKEQLIDFKNNGRHYDSVSLYGMDRVMLVDTEGVNIGQKHSPSNYWMDIESGKDLLVDLSVSESLGKRVFHFASVVKDSKGRRVGVVVARADAGITLGGIVNDFWGVGNYAGSAKAGGEVGNMDIELVGRDGSVLFSRYGGTEVKNNGSRYWGQVSPSIEQGARHGSFSITMPDESRRAMSGVFVKEPGFNDFKGSDWTLIVSVPEREILAPIYSLRNRIMLTVFVGCVLGAAFVYASVVYLIRPLKNLNMAVALMGQGSLGEALPVKSSDEVGMLTEAFNRMRVELKDRIDEKERCLSELHELNYVLQRSLKEVKILKGLLPICSSCKKIRNESGEWNSIERYISARTDAEFTHGICPECAFKLSNDGDYKN